MEAVKGDCTMGIFKVQEEGAEWEPSADVIVVLEGQAVLSDVSNVTKACSLLFGLIYSINLSFPKKLKYFFEVIQKLILGLDCEKLSPKIQSLKNKLHM